MIMLLLLHLNSRLQPKHRFELEFSDNQSDFNWLLDFLNHIGIPKGSALEKGREKFPVVSLDFTGQYYKNHNTI